MTNCIGCGGHDAPSETILCPGCWADYEKATAPPPLSESTRKALADFFERQSTRKKTHVASKSAEENGASQ